MKKKLLLLFAFVFLITGLRLTATALDDSTEVQFVEFAPQFHVISRFNNGVAPVVTNTGYALIDKNNSVLFVVNGEILGYQDGIVRVKTETGIDFIDGNQAVITSINDSRLIYAKNIVNGRIAVQRQDMKFGLMSVDQVLLLDYVYEDIVCSQELPDIVLCKKDSNWLLVDLSANTKESQIQNLIGYTELLIINNDGTNCGAIDYTGKVVIPYRYTYVEYDDQYIYAYTDTMIDWYTQSGDLVCSTVIEAENLSEGLFYDAKTAVFKDASGAIVIPNELLKDIQYAQEFYESFSVVEYDEGQSYITKNGTVATEKVWDCAYRFAQGYALVYNNVYDSADETSKKQWFIINTDFEVVKILDYDVYIDPYYPSSTDFSDGYIRTIDHETGLMGFIYLENHTVVTENRVRLLPTSLYRVDRSNQTLSEVKEGTYVGDFLKHFLNDSASLAVVSADGKTLSENDVVESGCRIQVRSSVDPSLVLDELTITVSAQSVETDPAETTPSASPDTTSDEPNTETNKPIINPGETSDQLRYLLIGVLAALLILVMLVVVFGRKKKS